jgi:molecular chaperone DnaJ
MNKDYYKILGVEKNATEEQIKKAFHKLAHEHHPDKANGNVDKFKEANEAYQVLGNKEKRAQYDQFGSTFSGGGFGGSAQGGSAWGGGQGSYNVNMDDLGDILGGFGDMFGFGGGRRSSGRTRAKRGRDLEMNLQLDWEEAIFGVKKNIKLEKNVNCVHCSGSGAEPGTKIETCATCHGSGQVTRMQRTILGNIQMQTTCETCNGAGKIIKEKCTKCRGRGVTNEKVELTVNIPAGIDNDETIRLTGQGEAGEQGGGAGDLYLRINVRANKNFERRGYDILTDLEITYSEATLGTKRDIKTIDSEVSLKIPAGTEAGQIFMLKGRGVQRLNSTGRGDHLVTVKIKVPKNISRQQRKILEELSQEGL